MLRFSSRFPSKDLIWVLPFFGHCIFLVVPSKVKQELSFNHHHFFNQHFRGKKYVLINSICLLLYLLAYFYVFYLEILTLWTFIVIVNFNRVELILGRRKKGPEYNLICSANKYYATFRPVNTWRVLTL